MLVGHLALAGLVFAAALPVAAAVPLPDTPTSFSAVGHTATFSFNGIIDGTLQAGLTSSITFRLTDIGNQGKIWKFVIDPANNMSAAPVTASRLSLYGFNVQTVGYDNASGFGLFSRAASGSFPQIGGGRLDVCFKTAGRGGTGNCAGGGGGGLDLGQGLSGTGNGFTLNFLSTVQSVTLNHFVVRYQSIDAPGIVGGSGIGRIDLGGGGDPLPVPEPATWAMLILGFGLVGAVRRRQAVVSA